MEARICCARHNCLASLVYLFHYRVGLQQLWIEVSPFFLLDATRAHAIYQQSTRFVLDSLSNGLLPPHRTRIFNSRWQHGVPDLLTSGSVRRFRELARR